MAERRIREEMGSRKYKEEGRNQCPGLNSEELRFDNNGNNDGPEGTSGTFFFL